MHPLVRETGRWIKRSRLRAMRRLSPDKIRYNSLLNQREFWQGRTRLASFPKSIQVGTNWTCNLKCFFCRRELGDRERLAQLPASDMEIPAAAMNRLMKVLPYVEVCTLTPLGEPLLYSGLPRLLAYYQTVGSKNLYLTTNGNVITDNRAKMLVQSQVRRVTISIDSANPERYAEMRVGGDLSRITEGLTRIQEWKRKLNATLPEVIFASTFMQRNIGDLPGLIQYAHDNNVKSIGVQLMEAESNEIEVETLKYHIPELTRVIEESERFAAEKGVQLFIHDAIRNLLSAQAGPEAEAAELLKSRPDLDTRQKTLIEKCSFPWTFLVVDTDADVRPCCWAGASYGNLARQEFDEIWNGPTNIEMRRKFLQNIIPDCCRGKHCRVDL